MGALVFGSMMLGFGSVAAMSLESRSAVAFSSASTRSRPRSLSVLRARREVAVIVGRCFVDEGLELVGRPLALVDLGGVSRSGSVPSRSSGSAVRLGSERSVRLGQLLESSA